MKHYVWGLPNKVNCRSYRIPFTNLFIYFGFHGCDGYAGREYYPDGPIIHANRTRGFEIGWQWDKDGEFSEYHTNFEQS